VIEATNRRERALGWLGAVPHWLYPTLLRQNGPLWSQVVVWLSTIGTFLTVTGVVFRVIIDDADRTRVYVNRDTGAQLGIDATMRASRWVRYGLHDFDFALISARPVRDIVVGLLLVGTTAVCVTGPWLALKRVRLDFRRAVRRRG